MQFSFIVSIFIVAKKSLKIPKGQSESIYQRTDNTMAKRKSTKGQTTIQNIHIKLKIE
jgi:hypothetical protein